MLPTWISHEPSVWAGAIAAVLEVAVALGVHIDPNAKAAILAAIPLVAALFVRQQVTPNAKLPVVG